MKATNLSEVRDEAAFDEAVRYLAREAVKLRQATQRLYEAVRTYQAHLDQRRGTLNSKYVDVNGNLYDTSEKQPDER